MNLPLQKYQGITPDQQSAYLDTQEFPRVPYTRFPAIIRNAIVAAGVNKKVAPEIVASVYLAAASLACLSLVEVIPVHTNAPEPAVLNVLIIAPSGAGKSTAFKPVMNIFNAFASQVNDDYQKEMKSYTTEEKIWNEIKKALNSKLRQAIKNNLNGEDESRAIKNHMRNEPRKPKRFKLVYQDISKAGLIRQLEDNPAVGIFLEEASVFFKSTAKDDPAIFNVGWDASPYSYVRNGVDCEITPRLMFCMLSQPDMFNSYLASNPDTARGSGLLPRFLMIRSDDTCIFKDEDFSHMLPALETFNNRITELLHTARQRFNDGITDKQQLKLSSEAIAFMGEKRAEMQYKIKEGGEWEHTPDIALKSGSNTLRLAAIFHYFSGIETEEISLNTVKCAHGVIEWYMQHACRIFHQNSRQYKFEKDVLEIYFWIHDFMTKQGRAIISKSEIMQLGPKRKSNNLREAKKLEPILAQLAWQKRIMLLQNATGGPVFIILPNQWSVFQDPSFRTDIFPDGCRSLLPSEIPGRVELNLPNLRFTW